MITPPPGWSVERTADGLLLCPPQGPQHALLHYAERVRPVGRALDIVRAARVPAGFVETATTAPRRLTTLEGEHGALVTRTGTIGEDVVELVYGFVFLDDYYAMVEGIAVVEPWRVVELVEHLVAGDVHLLGHPRRRRFVYTPPAGWQGTGELFDARWYPRDYPANQARILVNPALPTTPGLARIVLEKLGAGDHAPVRFTTMHGLEAEHYALGDMHVFLASDDQFLYSVRADLAVDAGRALFESIEPVPRPRSPSVETFRFWVD